MDDFPDLQDPRLTVRLGAALRAWRRSRGESRRTVAERSDATFSVGELRRLEHGRTRLTRHHRARLEQAYAVELPALLPQRDAVAVDVAAGQLAAAGIVMGFLPHDTTSLLVSYLELIKTLRGDRDARRLALRRADVEAIAAAATLDAEDVLDRLASLMGTSDQQRLAALAAFAAGAAVVVLGIGAVGTTIDRGDDAARVAPLVTARNDQDDETGDAPDDADDDRPGEGDRGGAVRGPEPVVRDPEAALPG